MQDRFNLQRMQKHAWEARAGRAPADEVLRQKVRAARASKIRKLRTEAERIAYKMHKCGKTFEEIEVVLTSRVQTETYKMLEAGVSAVELARAAAFCDRLESGSIKALPIASVGIMVDGKRISVALYDDED